ncbi:hypothetical protein [Paenibacillus sp. 1P03SA]|uniref:hypothetical protein n=1 Tax=Paenibacillus sp. 1P03SA TaxID=3132294 RepID=UPI0039A1C9DB
MKLKYKSIGLGILLYLININVFPLLIAYLTVALFQIDDHILRNTENIVEYIVWYLSVTLSSYISAYFSRSSTLTNTFVIGLFILIYSIVGTIADLSVSSNYESLVNILSDFLVIPFALLGGKLGLIQNRKNIR